MSPAYAFGAKAYHIMFAEILAKFGLDPEFAHDVAVEGWISAAKKGPHAFSGESDFIGFAIFKAGKIALDLKRRRREISGYPQRSEERIAVDEEGDQMREQARHELAKAMALLSPIERGIIELSHYEGLSDRAIAAYLMGDAEVGEAHRKSIQRRRRAAERGLRPWLEASGLDWESAVDALASSRSNRRRSPLRRRALPADPPGVSDTAPESNAA